MLVIHHAGLLLPGADREPLPGGAVLVEGRTVAAVGPYEKLAAASPGARVRHWPGVLTPGLRNPYGPELLEQAYHPDPREAGELGTEPLTGEALAALDMPEARWGASARRGVQRLLAHGTVGVAGELRREAVRDAVTRTGLRIERRYEEPPGPPTLDPLAGGRPAGEVFMPTLTEGGAADFAIFAVPPGDAPYPTLTTHGATTCIATAISGRLLHRRR
ncbi:imidazolonepropionase-like domain-containing protein [Streptomyces odonnellii]|uniref:imidazolonepropionase-like domain-containing protein n=1 Tax=Streptomyces odonnellii TaxID=1417980 RepID=UPI000625D325|nr:hypothetical protein [Streptomyces odonnellii]